MARRFIVVSEIFYPDETGTAFYLKHIAIEMSKHWDTVVITREGDHLFGRIENSEPNIGDQLSKISIHRIPVYQKGSGQLYYRILAALQFSCKVIQALISIPRKGDIVYCATNLLC